MLQRKYECVVGIAAMPRKEFSADEEFFGKNWPCL